MTFYKDLNLTELRELVLCKQVDASLMEKEDYERLFNYEIDLKDPNINILNFCIDGLKEYNEYHFDFGNNHLNAIKDEYNRRNNIIFKKKYKNVKRLLIAVITALILMIFQFVSLAFGFNIFNYIFNWYDNPDAVIVQGFPEDVDTEEEYEHFYYDTKQIPNSIINLIPQNLLINNDLCLTYISKNIDYINIYFSFNDNSDNFFAINIFKSNMAYWEKDDNWVDIEIINGITYNYYTNIELNCCLWEYDGFVYKVETSKSVDELKEIVKSFNHKIE